MIKIAIIGLGSMGKNHYRILQSIDEVEITGLCDPYILQNDFSHKVFHDVDYMLENIKIDAAFVIVPTFLHKEIAIKCIEKNIDVFIEKPVASTTQEANEILEAVKKYQVKSAVGYVERFNPVVNALKNELQEKSLYTISVTRVGPFPPRIADVGILTDLAVHDIDLIRFISGKNITNVNIFKSRKIHDHHEDNAVLSFELENDIIASITTSWLTPYKKRVMEVACKEALFEADLMAQDLTEYSHYQGTNAFNSYAIRKCIVKKEEPLLNEIKAFINYLKTGERGDLATIEDSIETIRVSKMED